MEISGRAWSSLTLVGRASNVKLCVFAVGLEEEVEEDVLLTFLEVSPQPARRRQAASMIEIFFISKVFCLQIYKKSLSLLRYA